MIRVEERERIRRAYFIKHKSMRQIAKELRHSRATVKKAIESAEPGEYRLKKPRPAPLLGPYKARIDELLAESEGMPRKQRYTGHKIYQIIRVKGYRGAESTVRGYIAQRRKEKKRPKVYIPLEFDPGMDAQVDWGEAVVILAGKRVTVQMFVMRLCYSRRMFVMAFPTQKQEAFFEGHVRAFHHFQGLAQRKLGLFRRMGAYLLQHLFLGAAPQAENHEGIIRYVSEYPEQHDDDYYWKP